MAASIIGLVLVSLYYLHPWTTRIESHPRVLRPSPLNVFVSGDPGPSYSITEAGFPDAHTAWLVTRGSPARAWIWRETGWTLAFEGPSPTRFGLMAAGGWFALVQGTQLLVDGGSGGGPGGGSVPAGCQLLSDRSGPRLCLVATPGALLAPMPVHARQADGTTWRPTGRLDLVAPVLAGAIGMTGDGRVAWVAEGDADRSLLATSSDAGATWFQSVFAAPPGGPQLHAFIGPVDGRGPNIAVAVRWYDGQVADHLAIEASHDGGHTFNPASLPSGSWLANPWVSMASDRDWAVISQNQFAITHDAGVTWKVRHAPANGLFVDRLNLTPDGAIFCLMAAKGSGDSQRLFRSLDDGVTFAEIALPPNP